MYTSLIDSGNLSKVYEDESALTKAKKLTKILYSSITRKSIIPLCFLANFIVRLNIIMLSNFMTLWTSSFIGQNGGIRDS